MGLSAKTTLENSGFPGINVTSASILSLHSTLAYTPILRFFT